MVNLIKDSERGDLMAFDTIDVPFYVKRIFVVNNVPISEERGNHAHFENLQYLICLEGSIDVINNDGKSETVHDLRKGECVFLDKLTWSKQIYTNEKTSIMVLCSHEYDKNDYITDFEEFKKLVNEN